MSTNEFILSALVIAGVVLALYFIFKSRIDNEELDIDIYAIDYLCDEIKKNINEIVNMDLSTLRLNKRDLNNRKMLKRELSDAVRHCSQGNASAKRIVVARIKSLLASTLKITEEVINETIPFDEPKRLSVTEKYEILLYLQKQDKEDGENRKLFRGICETIELDKLKKDERGYYYSITEEEIEEAYDKLQRPLSYDDKLNILTQRIYEEAYGLSVVDLMIMDDESLDSISGGVSGVTKDNYRYMEEDIYNGEVQKPRTHESIWMVYSGKPIHLKFLSFKDKATIVRICKNLAESRKVGHFTSSEGGIKTSLADGSRATVFRPNNGSQWVFWVRKFGSASTNELSDLLTDEGKDKPVNVVNWTVKGCLNLIFSGDQNSGKTTDTRAAARVVDRRQPLRTIEADFELYLNDAYADRNIVGTVPSKRMPFAKLIELLKSAEAHTILFGETASLEHAKYLIDLLLAGTKRIITTGHWPTPDEMVSYFVHAMGAYGGGNSGEVEALVARLLHIDVHCVKNNEGHRYIDRITEIIPLPMDYEKPNFEDKLDNVTFYLERMARKKTYYTRDLIVWENGEYKAVHPFSERLTDMILKNLPPEEREAFLAFNRTLEGGAEEAC